MSAIARRARADLPQVIKSADVCENVLLLTKALGRLAFDKELWGSRMLSRGNTIIILVAFVVLYLGFTGIEIAILKRSTKRSRKY